MLIEHAEQRVREGCEATLASMVAQGMIREGTVDSVEWVAPETFIVRESVWLMPKGKDRLVRFTLNIDPTGRDYTDFEGFDDKT
jgi:hypothetical protein